MEEGEPVEAVLLVGAQGGAQFGRGGDGRLFVQVLQAVVARLQFEEVVGALFEVLQEVVDDAELVGREADVVFFDFAAFQPRRDFLQPFLRQDAEGTVAEGDVVLFFQDGFLQVFQADLLVAKADGKLQVEPVDAAGGAAFDCRGSL